MNKIIWCIALLFIAAPVFAQKSSIRFLVRDAERNEPLQFASVYIKGTKNGTTTDSTGLATLNNIPDGKSVVVFSYGEVIKEETIEFPYKGNQPYEVLISATEEEEEVIVQSTRTSRTIQNTPTRIEVIELEEIDEKSNMRPANVSMLLHESTGIQVQQTSATSANASIRIQGLDGRYTQLLKDGFATFGNFASGLSVLEIPPLDLKQVEIIKGPASTLYGGGAIAGVVDFISKTPVLNRSENSFLLNQSNIGQTNAGFFSSARGKKMGYTFLGLYNRQHAYDVDKDDFTELPKSREFTVHPKLFFYFGEKSTLIIGNSFTKGKREGGDVQVIKGKGDATHQYFETNKTSRNITTVEFSSKVNMNETFQVKQSYSIFDRQISIPSYSFDGTSHNSFTDISYIINSDGHTVVTGANVVYDKFIENRNNADDRDNKSFTVGGYVQYTRDFTGNLKLESGIRLDQARYSNDLFAKSEFFALPRVSLMVKYNPKLTSRIGAGMGYKLPTLFTERTETFQYQGVAQLNKVKSERSYGATADINYRTELLEELDFSFNHMFFYTWISKPLVLEDNGGGNFSFANQRKPVQSFGFETNAKFIYRHDFKLFLGYTFTDARAKYLATSQFLPLVPKHKLNSALIYEKHDFLKLGLEGYYTSPQFLFNGLKTESFWEFGFMAEKLFEKFSIYINFENFTDVRQSKFKRVVNEPHDSPTFDDIWTHTEGFVVNGGIKVKL